MAALDAGAAAMNGRRGMIWIELLAALAALALVSLLGIRALSALLVRLSEEGQRQAERALLDGLQARMARAWEQRSAHRFAPGDWLIVEGRSSDGWVELERLWIRGFDADGAPGSWELRWSGGAWLERAVAPDGAVRSERTVAYSGALAVDLPAGRLGWGDPVPPAIRVRIPGAKSTRMRGGFAIHTVW